jgi:copper(I)-binding protein
MGDHHPHLESINMRVDPSSSHVMIMELRGEADAEGRVGYVLRFNKNGELISSELLTAPPVEPPPPPPAHETHSTGSKKR